MFHFLGNAAEDSLVPFKIYHIDSIRSKTMQTLDLHFHLRELGLWEYWNTSKQNKFILYILVHTYRHAYSLFLIQCQRLSLELSFILSKRHLNKDILLNLGEQTKQFMVWLSKPFLFYFEDCLKSQPSSCNNFTYMLKLNTIKDIHISKVNMSLSLAGLTRISNSVICI